MQTESTIPTAAQIRASRTLIESEVATAQAEHDAAAFDAATNPGNEDARARLRDARQRLDTLTAELDGMDAVEREAGRRGRIAAKQSERDALESKQADALAAIDAAAKAHAQVLALIDKLGTAWADFKTKETAANTALMGSYGHFLVSNQNVIASRFELTTQVKETMLNATGGALDCNNTGEGIQTRTPEFIATQIAETVRKAKLAVNQNIIRRDAELGQSLAAAA